MMGNPKREIRFAWQVDNGNHPPLTEYQIKQCATINKFLNDHKLMESLQISILRGGDDEMVYHTNRIGGYMMLPFDFQKLNKAFELLGSDKVFCVHKANIMKYLKRDFLCNRHVTIYCYLIDSYHFNFSVM